MKVFGRSGISFKYHGDVLLWKWPWARGLYGAPYHSSFLTKDFNNFNEYWILFGEDRAFIKIGGGKGKIHGFDLTEEVIPQWSSRVWPNEYIVCLFNIDPSAKGPKFWSIIDKEKRIELLKDVVVLRCKDKTEMNNLLDSIDKNFASAIGVFNGSLVGSNVGVY
jgi:hypothetical protein